MLTGCPGASLLPALPGVSPWVGASRRAAPYLLQPIEHWDEEADIWQSLVVEIPDPLHQLWGRGHCRRRNKQEAQGLGVVGWTLRRRNEWWWVCGRGGDCSISEQKSLAPGFLKCILAVYSCAQRN